MSLIFNTAVTTAVIMQGLMKNHQYTLSGIDLKVINGCRYCFNSVNNFVGLHAIVSMLILPSSNARATYTTCYLLTLPPSLLPMLLLHILHDIYYNCQPSLLPMLPLYILHDISTYFTKILNKEQSKVKFNIKQLYHLVEKLNANIC